MEIAIVVGAAVLLFGGSKIRDVARGLGAAKREFSIGQAEADAEAERIRAAARARAEAARDEARVESGPAMPTPFGGDIPPPIPGSGTTAVPTGAEAAADVKD
jgi:Sec-independent protein translocase protein TatA